MRRAAGILAAVAAAMATWATGVAAAAAPTAVTAPASDVTSTSATLNARVSPNKEDTTYYFEYGTTTAYGSRTPNGGPIGGNADRAVSATVTGLTPSTTYHYRVVAVNPSGTVQGADVTFTTAGPGGPGATIAASKPTITFGAKTTISGVVTGNGAAGAQVTLTELPFPFTGPFKNVATVTADGAGAYSFTVAPGVNTRYRVEARTSPRTTSGEITVRVRVRVGLRLSDTTPARGQRVRFSGIVSPAHDGKVAKIQRRTATGWKTIATPTLVATTPRNGVARSRYSTRLRIRATNRYRAVVTPKDGDHVRGISPRRRAVVG